MFSRFSTKDLIIITILAAIGIAIKPIVGPLSKMISAPLMIPGGSLAGGFYMMWLALAILIVRKTGTGTLFGILQGVIVLLVGLQGNQGALSLLSYSLPGLLADLLPVIKHKGTTYYAHLLICLVANVAGSVIVAWLIFGHPYQLIIGIAALACISAALGAGVSWGTYKSLYRYRIIT